MSLSFPVKINQITNLSDARYCAGMGVEMAGFPIITASSEELNAIKAITGWISGVKIVGEFTKDYFDKAEMLVAELGLELIEINHYEDLIIPASLQTISIIKIESNDPNLENLIKIIESYPSAPFYHLINESLNKNDWIKICGIYPIIYGNQLTNKDLGGIIQELKPKAISLNGGEEIAPGLKDFEQLASVLEFLEL